MKQGSCLNNYSRPHAIVTTTTVLWIQIKNFVFALINKEENLLTNSALSETHQNNICIFCINIRQIKVRSCL